MLLQISSSIAALMLYYLNRQGYVNVSTDYVIGEMLAALQNASDNRVPPPQLINKYGNDVAHMIFDAICYMCEDELPSEVSYLAPTIYSTNIKCPLGACHCNSYYF